MDIQSYDGKIPSARRGRSMSTETRELLAAIDSLQPRMIRTSGPETAAFLVRKIRQLAGRFDYGVSAGIDSDDEGWFVAFQGREKLAKAAPKPAQPEQKAKAPRKVPVKKVTS